MSEICGVLSNEGEMSLLSWCPVFRVAGQCESEWFVVGADVKPSTLEKVGKVLDSRVNCEELPVEGAVGLLGLVQLPGEEC